jgi:hypothetical protein
MSCVIVAVFNNCTLQPNKLLVHSGEAGIVVPGAAPDGRGRMADVILGRQSRPA